MEEVEEFCIRVLGSGAQATEATQEALSNAGSDRVDRLAAAAHACRARADPAPVAADHVRADAAGSPADAPSLAAAVALEMAAATAALPERQREALVLRDSLQLSHAQVAAIVGIDRAAVAPLLARARLGLRAARRGTPLADADCGERDRALRVITQRLDSEPLESEDGSWLLAHLGSCQSCIRDHAAMLEASACFRAWR